VGDVPDAASQAQAREAVAAYQELLREYPDYAARDAALYQLAAPPSWRVTRLPRWQPSMSW